MSKIYLNNEAAIIYDVIDLVARTKRDVVQTYHMMVDMEEYFSAADEYQGFVRTMKIAFAKESRVTRKEIIEQRSELEKQL